MAVRFEGYERRIEKITKCLNEYGISSLEEARQLCLDAGFDPEQIVRGVQPIAFDNAVLAYTLGCAVALKKGCRVAAEAAEAIGIGIQAFCVPGSVADQREVGLGHGRLGAMLLREETKCFCFLAGHESFAAAEGAIGIVRTANKVRKEPLKVILNGLGKDAAYIISRVNGFTYVKTEFDYCSCELKIVETRSFSNGERAKILCYGADDVSEGVAIMIHESVDVSITATQPAPPVSSTPSREPTVGAPARQKYSRWRAAAGEGQNAASLNMAAGPARLQPHRHHHGKDAFRRAVRELLVRTRASR